MVITEFNSTDGKMPLNSRSNDSKVESIKQEPEDWLQEDEATFGRPLVKLMKSYYVTAMRLAYRGINNLPQLLSELRAQDLLNEVKTLISNHPIAAVSITLMGIACGIPIFIFVAFAIITIFFTICGFLVVEGAVLAAGSFTLLLCLASLAVAFITMGFFGGLLFITYKQIDRMLNKTIVSEENLQHLEAHLPQILASLKSLPHASHHRVRTPHSNNGHTHLHNLK